MMKIIGKTGKAYIAQIEGGEIARILGIETERSDAVKEALKTDRVPKKSGPWNSDDVDWEGLEIPVAKIYSSARRVARGWDGDYGFNQAIETLEGMITQLKHLSGTYKPLPIEEAKAND